MSLLVVLLQQTTASEALVATCDGALVGQLTRVPAKVFTQVAFHLEALGAALEGTRVGSGGGVLLLVAPQAGRGDERFPAAWELANEGFLSGVFPLMGFEFVPALQPLTTGREFADELGVVSPVARQLISAGETLATALEVAQIGTLG